MSGFGFEITLCLNDFNTLTIQPPHSLALLSEIAIEKFNLPKVDLHYFDDENTKIKIKSEDEYLKMFNYVSDREMKEVAIFIQGDDKLKKKTANRKNSRAMKPQLNFESGGGAGRKFSNFNDNDNTLNNFHDAENEKDLRNLRTTDQLDDGVGYNKHSYNKKNQLRIHYIKEKKQIIKEEKEEKERIKEEQKRLEMESQMEDLNFGKKNKNRAGNKVMK